MEEKKVLRGEKEIAEYITIANDGGGSTIDVDCVDASGLTDMSFLFDSCENITHLDLSKFDTSSATDMTYMFGLCRNIRSLDLSNFDTSKVRDMTKMFSGCEKLESIDLSNFNTSKVRDMSGMFHCCLNLTSLDISNFDMGKVFDMHGMFYKINPNVEIYLSADSPSVGKIQEQLIKDEVFGAKVHVGGKKYYYDASLKKWKC